MITQLLAATTMKNVATHLRPAMLMQWAILTIFLLSAIGYVDARYNYAKTDFSVPRREDLDIWNLMETSYKHKGSDIATFYDMLGVPLDATPKDIKEKMRDLVKDHHPDKQDLTKSKTELDALEAIFTCKKDIANVLRDPFLRHRYEYWRMNGIPRSVWRRHSEKIGIPFAIIIVLLIVSLGQYGVKYGLWKKDHAALSILRNNAGLPALDSQASDAEHNTTVSGRSSPSNNAKSNRASRRSRNATPSQQQSLGIWSSPSADLSFQIKTVGLENVDMPQKPRWGDTLLFYLPVMGVPKGKRW